MYETLEHWKQYKQEKELQNKIAQEYELFNECGFQYKEKAKQKMDKFLAKLRKKNGTTKY
jgi:predicted solute-binding protein